MKSKILKLVSAAILPFIVLLSSLVPVSALLQYGYIISSYDVDVKSNTAIWETVIMLLY